MNNNYMVFQSAHERKKEEITQNLALRRVRKEGKKSSVQNFSNELVHERKKEEITQSLRSVRKEGRNISNNSVGNISIEEFIENHDTLEVNHVASVHKEVNEKPNEYKILDNQYDTITQNYASSVQEGAKSVAKFIDRKFSCKICDKSFSPV